MLKKQTNKFFRKKSQRSQWRQVAMTAQVNTNLTQGKIIAVCGAKGGIGKTLLSVNLSIALNKKNLDVCILDADFQFGDVSLSMDLQPSFSIKDIIEQTGKSGASSISSFLTRHSSGVNVLSAPERPEFAEIVTNERLAQTLNHLKEDHDYVVVDNAIGLQEQTVEIMDKADEILVITNLEMSALKNTKLMLETMGQLGFREKVRLVVNRYNMESLIKGDDVPGMLGEKEAFYIPNNFKIASQSLNLGLPFTISQSKSDLAKSVFKMAKQLTTAPEETTDHKSSKKQSVFKKWLPSNG